MTKQRYSFKTGFGTTDLDAQAIGEFLEDLRAKHGGSVKPEDVIDAAKDESCPAHRYFEWDDSKAAIKWRTEQARKLIREVQVLWVEPKGPREVEATIRSGPAFVNTERNGTGYQSFREMIRTPEGRTALLERALEDLVSVQNRYDVLADDLGGVRSAVAEFGKKVADHQRRTAPKRKVA